MKNIFGLGLAMTIALTLLAGCGEKSSSSAPAGGTSPSGGSHKMPDGSTMDKNMK